MASNRPSEPRDRLEKAMSRLRPIERDVLLLSAREGLSNGEIEARLGLAAEAVEAILARALCRFDSAIERQERPWWRFW